MINKVAGAGVDCLDKASDEFNVEPKLTLPPVVVRFVFAPRVSALPKFCMPVVATEPPLSSVVPVPFTVSEAKTPPAPTVPPKVVVPLPETVSPRAVLALSLFTV